MDEVKSIRVLLTIGILASIVVGVGEWLLHFLPDGPGGEIKMLEKVPLGRASFGHFLVVFGAPLYFAGYYGLMRFFESTSAILSKLLFVCGILSFSIGGVWVSSRYFAAEVLQRSSGTLDYDFYLASYESHYQILVWVLRIFVVTGSVLFVILVLKNRIGIPKWYAIFNPIVLLLFVLSTLIWIKPLGVHLAPIAMNITHLIFFSLILFQVKMHSH